MLKPRCGGTCYDPSESQHERPCVAQLCGTQLQVLARVQRWPGCWTEQPGMNEALAQELWPTANVGQQGCHDEQTYDHDEAQ